MSHYQCITYLWSQKPQLISTISFCADDVRVCKEKKKYENRCFKACLPHNQAYNSCSTVQFLFKIQYVVPCGLYCKFCRCNFMLYLKLKLLRGWSSQVWLHSFLFKQISYNVQIVHYTQALVFVIKSKYKYPHGRT